MGINEAQRQLNWLATILVNLRKIGSCSLRYSKAGSKKAQRYTTSTSGVIHSTHQSEAAHPKVWLCVCELLLQRELQQLSVIISCKSLAGLKECHETVMSL